MCIEGIMAEVVLDPYDSEYLYEYTFDELIDKVPYNPDNEKVRIELTLYPILLIRLSRQFKRTISYTECHIQATRLGCAKLQHHDKIKLLIERSDKVIDSDENIFAFNDLINTSGYPYETNTANGRFKISVLEWVNSYIDLNSISLGIPKGQLTAICFLIGLSDYSKLSESRSKEINKELNKFWGYIDYKLSLYN